MGQHRRRAGRDSWGDQAARRSRQLHDQLDTVLVRAQIMMVPRPCIICRFVRRLLIGFVRRHTRTPNLSGVARRVFWQVYKRSDQPHFHGEDINLSRKFIEAEIDEGRRTLMGVKGWETSWLEVDPAPSATPKLCKL